MFKVWWKKFLKLSCKNILHRFVFNIDWSLRDRQEDYGWTFQKKDQTS